MDKDGVKGMNRPAATGNLSCIRADSLFPYNMLDVIQCVTNVECLMIMDPMRKQMEKLKILSNHTWIDYMRFKEVRKEFVDYFYCCLVCFLTKFQDVINITNDKMR